MKPRTLLLTLLTLFLALPATADDTEIFWEWRIDPNVVILMDSSGSMNGSIDGEQKIDIAKQAINGLIANVTGVRFGVFKFADGAGEMIAPLGTDKAAAIAAIDEISASGWTPLGGATETIQDYYLGEYLGCLSPPDPDDTTFRCLDCDKCKKCVGDDCGECDCKGCELPGPDECKDCVCQDCFCEEWKKDEGKHCDCLSCDLGGDAFDYSSGDKFNCDGISCFCEGNGCDCDEKKGTCKCKKGKQCDVTLLYDCPSPIEYECQKSFAVLMTDGLPARDTASVEVAASSLFATDHVNLPGLQNVIVHTVGFDVPSGAALLTQTASNGGGQFFTASNAEELRDALQNAIAAIVTKSFSFTAPLVPSTGVAGGDKAYVASFEPDTSKPLWPGYLRAYRRNAQGQIPVDADGNALASALVWDAGALLASTPADNRTIYTAVGSSLESFTANNNSLTPEMLGVAGQPGKKKLVDFVRGLDTYDTNQNGDTTEERDWKLGDIFHSSPVLVFPPPGRNSDADYHLYRQTHANRTPILLVGANDGMLHAFRESDGAELWAFIPPDALGKLNLMARNIGSHPIMVDGTPIVADVKFGDAWKTVAVLPLRAGGRSYHALDITNTTSPRYLWSFSDSRLGETWSEPAIAPIRMADGTVKWVAFVGGGFDSLNNNASGKAVFAIDLQTGQKLWEYSSAVAGDGGYMNFSLVSRPTVVDLDRDGFIDYVYLADVGGQVWKFDTSAPATLSGGRINNWSGRRLFVADPAQANPPASGEHYPSQGMFVSPTLAYDKSGHLWVFIGSGDREHPMGTSQNRLFAIKDDGSMTNATAITSADLVSAKSTDEVTHGWYLPLAASEKVLSSADVFDGVAYFATYLPNPKVWCQQPEGIARLYAMKSDTGHAAIDWDDGDLLDTTDGTEERSKIVGTGVPGEPKVSVSEEAVTVVVTTTDEDITQQGLPNPSRKVIRYWREVF